MIEKSQFDFTLLEQSLLDMGAWRVLPADLSAIPVGQRQGMPRGVSISVAVDLSIINDLAVGVSPSYVDEYDRLNLLLDRLAESATDIIIRQGHRAISMSRSHVKVEYSSHETVLPHKTVATRAGLGWIGKNALLVTSDRGSAIRLTSVLTDAPFSCAEPVNESGCGTCDACVRNCPGQAPRGPNWTVGSSREDFFDVLACRKTCVERTWKTKPGLSVCGLCIAVCPLTQKAIREAGLTPRFPVPEFASRGDIDEIIALQKLCFMREAERIQKFDIAPMTQTSEVLRADLENPRQALTLLKLVEDRRIVGSVRGVERDGTLYIGRLVVHPDYQKRGYGKRLMAAIEQCHSGARYELFTGDKSIENRRFYQNLGYREFDVREIMEGVRLVYFEK